ncbi:UNVERIFIED_CONTAM: hypothetical protein HDU68_001152 [Siphonaria sp. JEL0065]|nr:hypothetical protein HDU68_001152 [Siphonaria sp. JEL0065]
MLSLKLIALSLVGCSVAAAASSLYDVSPTQTVTGPLAARRGLFSDSESCSSGQLLLPYTESKLAINGTSDTLSFFTSTAVTSPRTLIVCAFGLRHDLGECFSQNFDAVVSNKAVIVAPYFACNNKLNVFRIACLQGELCWSSCNGFASNDFAQTGSDSPSTIVDNVIKTTMKQYPSIQNVVAVGFSLGAQFINHYAAITALPDSIPMRFVFASASGYLYLDTKRPTSIETFKEYNSRNCPTFDDWKYGLTGYFYPGMRERLLSRDLTILGLKYDNGCGVGSASCSCEVLAQSNGVSNRFVLAKTYYHYLFQAQGKTAGLTYQEIDTCGHDACCFYNDFTLEGLVAGHPVVAPTITVSSSLPASSSLFITASLFILTISLCCSL